MRLKATLLSLSALGLLMASSPVFAQQNAGNGNYPVTHLETRLSDVEGQMRLLTGKVEQLDYALRRMSQALQRMQEDYEIRFNELEKNQRKSVSVPATPPQPTAQQDGLPDDTPIPTTPVVGTLGSMNVRDGQVTGGSVSPEAPALPDTPPDYGLTPDEQYERAFALLRQAEYDQAEQAFKSFYEKNDKNKLTANAKYWYAETFYVRGKYSEAAVAFAEAYQYDSKGSKAPDSLLKLAMSLRALKKDKDACNTLAALKAKHPKASSSIKERAADIARKLSCK